MKIQVIVSVITEDKADFINQLSVSTRELGGTWLAQKSVHLDGQFAGLFRLEIEDSDLDAFKSLINKTDAITARISEITPTDADAVSDIKINLECDDRRGLTADISKILANVGVTVLNFESHRYPVMGLDTGVYSAQLELSVPKNLYIDELKAQIEALGDSVQVFITES